MYQSPVPDLVPVTGLEPVRGCPQGILSPWCLPFHHTGMLWRCAILHRAEKRVKKKGRRLGRLGRAAGAAGACGEAGARRADRRT